jgi:DNA-directed RNA polymerase subunit M/transcription elongation factor TFIIS
MSNEVHFCLLCNNMTFLHLKEVDGEDNVLVHHCKSCQNDEPMAPGETCVYTLDFQRYDKSKMINQNKYLTHDVTIPTIRGNENLKCTNPECFSIKEKKPSQIRYIKYDTEEMSYLYICEICGQKWTNQ